MTNERMPDAQTKRRSSGVARFWLPFGAIVLAFTGIAIAYASSERVREAAPGAVRKAPAAEDAAPHGLEPEAEPAPPRP
ncbi:MAG: hypothetical protein K0R38_2889 [Polyangiaceae bacterium]|jgi:hypothetical protein|nr:hypothetical protein [Polyangiaceae bacterium]